MRHDLKAIGELRILFRDTFSQAVCCPRQKSSRARLLKRDYNWSLPNALAKATHARLKSGNADSRRRGLQFTLSGLVTALKECGSTILLIVRQASRRAP